ncbi:methylmalonyl-CoA/ethylmalonyl-CoA epimerase/glyoxylase I family protein [Persephonella hydrogeniphila]|uniref:Methylmalonyl-CoA/ethylmalonyl-CoA epimerase/glyoxylase I family protein n=1 Tax=Persephonella hydrogeniphila TaxID=198703 RepID=A0A285N541_9AQUI|nr:VOC family protein [Persephonella hydrogeniphila]SNZ02841.1 methylmalonyl-CoA/ethylmalonyl-CoA epimerase/glyoxylase I family protein [Persephonella hydrogeniphila]
MEFNVHHIAISVSDINKAVEFYSYFGFREVVDFTAGDNSFRIKHLKSGDFIIELFWFRDRVKTEKKELWEDLKINGYRHIAFKVNDIHKALEKLKQDGIAEEDTEVSTGKTGILYFFVKDPDGNFVEIVQDNRNL